MRGITLASILAFVASTTFGFLITIDLADKEVTVDSVIAVRESVPTVVTNISPSVASNLVISISDRYGNLLASNSSLTNGTGDSAGCTLDLNTTELVAEFDNTGLQKDQTFTLGVWDTALSKLLVNDTISVRNNPYTPGLPDPTGVVQVITANYDLNGYTFSNGTFNGTHVGDGSGLTNITGASGVTDGDKGDITVSGGGNTWQIDDDTVGAAEIDESAMPTVAAMTITAGTNQNPLVVTGLGGDDDATLLNRGHQLLLRNTNDTHANTFAREVHLGLRAGVTNDYRRYIDFLHYNGTNQWIFGANATGQFTFYSADDEAHRFFVRDNSGGSNNGEFEINSVGTGAVEINNGADAVGTGGFAVYDGGAAGESRTNVFSTTASATSITAIDAASGYPFTVTSKTGPMLSVAHDGDLLSYGDKWYMRGTTTNAYFNDNGSSLVTRYNNTILSVMSTAGVNYNSGNYSGLDFSVGGVSDDYLLRVDASANRVGINAGSTPTATLDVGGTIKATTLTLTGDAEIGGYVVSDNTRATKDPTGFEDPANVTVTYDPTARTITLAQTGGIDVWWRGTNYTVSSPWTSAAHAADADSYYLYSNTDGTNWTWSTTGWQFSDIQVAYVYKGASDTWALREVHGAGMDWATHQELHRQVGTHRVSGGTPTAGTYALDTGTDAANTPGFDLAVIQDEDLPTTVPAWTEGEYTILYFSASNTPVFVTNSTSIAHITGTYPDYYVNGTNETEASTGQYLNYYQILSPMTADSQSQLYRMTIIQPQFAYGSLAAAQSEDYRTLSLGPFTALGPEYVAFTRITIRTSASYGTTGKFRIFGISYLTGSQASQTVITSLTSPSTADAITTDTSGFAGNLSAADTTVQLALDLLDNGVSVVTDTSGETIIAVESSGTVADGDDVLIGDIGVAGYGKFLRIDTQAGDVSVQGTLNVTNNASVGGDLDVTGALTFGSLASEAMTLIVSNVNVLAQEITTTTNVIVGGDLTVTGNVTAASFSGGGSGLTGVDAATVDSLEGASFAQVSGDTYTGTHVMTGATVEVKGLYGTDGESILYTTGTVGGDNLVLSMGDAEAASYGTSVDVALGSQAITLDALTVTAPGVLSARIPVYTVATNRTWTGAELDGSLVCVTAETTQTVAGVESGNVITFTGIGSVAITVDCDGSDYITLAGVQAAAGEAIVSGGDAGDQVTLVGQNTTNWMVVGRTGTWAEESP